ncbi:response regulator [Nisaea acidiphila]|uniref:Response regulator n=1 Tax=Nisaea acidiphila TaxID=1862145 RepID=A0A9J7AR37_9PROT|nr:response regulator [Nisaea acidiphila]UUX50075.1 response regulator [Nisaea acidiphila]
MTDTQSKPVILFVDDEPNILSGLRRMLRTMRGEWQMEFLTGGQEALDRMGAEPFDAVVSDMRMPSVDGVAVLTAAATRNPESIRFILSGYAEQEAMLEALGYAHRFIAKPCDADVLVSSLKSAFGVRDLLPMKDLRVLLGSLKSVPVLSDRYLRLVREIDDPTTSTNIIAKTIEEDLGLSAQILRLANSAYFNLNRKLSSCRQAIDVLGLDTVRALLTVSEFYLSEEVSPEVAQESKKLAERSLILGGVTRRIAQELKMDEAGVEQAASAGLLAHIGTAILRINHPDTFEKAMAMVETGEAQVSAAERVTFGASHAELGAYLMGLWGFADEVVEAVAFHHNPDNAQTTGIRPLSVLHISQAIVGAKRVSDSGLFSRNPDIYPLDEAYLEKVGLKERAGTLAENLDNSMGSQ